MNIKDINLETCPFCDGGATMREDGIHMPVIDPDTGAVVDCRDEEAEGYIIECSNCPAQIVAIKETGESEAELEQRAIKAWNRREGEEK
jgi:hypothetical protein|nr:MAG TPA: restriction alleviation protein [Caudoviricetes sp.]